MGEGFEEIKKAMDVAFTASQPGKPYTPQAYPSEAPAPNNKFIIIGNQESA